jgi:hypothetical protein
MVRNTERVVGIVISTMLIIVQIVCLHLFDLQRKIIMNIDFISFAMGYVVAAVMFAMLFETVFGEMRED